MTLNDVTLYLDGTPIKVERVDIEFHHERYCDDGLLVSSAYSSSPEQEVQRSNCRCSTKIKVEGSLDRVDERKKQMSELKKIPENLRRFLNDEFKAFYQLGIVDEELALTDFGKDELLNFLLRKYEKEFGEMAKEEVSVIKAKEELEKGK